MKKYTSVLALTFVFAASLVAGGCSSKKAVSEGATASDTSAMQPTQVAKNDANLCKASSGRAR